MADAHDGIGCQRVQGGRTRSRQNHRASHSAGNTSTNETTPTANPNFAQPISPPPANTGALTIPTAYPREQVAGILDLAGKWGVDGDQLHVFATAVLEYVYGASTHSP